MERKHKVDDAELEQVTGGEHTHVLRQRFLRPGEDSPEPPDDVQCPQDAECSDPW